MTLAEYLDAQRFPLTTRPNVAPREQFLADAVYYYQLVELRDTGVALNKQQQAKLAELMAKMPHQDRLLARMRHHRPVAKKPRRGRKKP